MEKNNILLLDVPNVSLVNKRLLNDINAGGIAIAGSWDANQYSVDHYDLNAKLNKYRPREEIRCETMRLEEIAQDTKQKLQVSGFL